MKRLRSIAVIILSAALWASAGHQSASASHTAVKKTTQPTKVVAQDIVMKALQDELARCDRLQLTEHQKPYFVSYLLRDSDLYSVSASFGALTSDDQDHDRSLAVDLHVGSFELDNSDSMFDYSGANRRDQDLPLEDDYDAIRNAVWLRTDWQYKAAVSMYENLLSIMKQKQITERSPSYSKAEPTVSEAPKSTFSVDKDKWENTVRQLSAVFRDYPSILTAKVTFTCRARTKWHVNTEGSRNRDSDTGASVMITATGQTKDGARVSDFDLVSATDASGLPSKEELLERTTKLAKNVAALSAAAPAEEYEGPILFEGQAAADFFSQALVPRILNPTESIMQLAFGMQNVQNKPGKRILPTYLSVADDPLAQSFCGQALKGGYKIDDEGVPAQRVEAIKDGVIQTFCSGRKPGKYVSASNGHYREGSVRVSQVLITASKTAPLSELKKRMMEMGKDQGLKYVLLVRHLDNPNLGSSLPFDFGAMAAMRSDVALTQPTLLYKVFVDDGHEELVRSAKFVHVSDKILRSIVAAGDDSAVRTMVQSGSIPQTTSLVTPSVLVCEIDIEPEQGMKQPPTYLPNPYSAK